MAPGNMKVFKKILVDVGGELVSLSIYNWPPLYQSILIIKWGSSIPK